MSKQICLANLKKIVSMDEETSQRQVLSGELESFFQEIADELFLLPPLNSRGHKFRHMLWNHLNLKTEIKTSFDEEVFSRWQSFHKMPKAGPIKTSRDARETEKTPGDTEKDEKTNQLEPKRGSSRSVEAPVEETRKAPATLAKTEKAGPKRPASKQAATKASAIRKTVPKKASAKKNPPRKKPPTMAKVTPSGDVKKRQARNRGLTKDTKTFTTEFKSIEKRIKRIEKTVDGISGQKGVETKSGKKTAPQKTTVKKSARLSETDRVIKVILKSKKGIDVASLSNKTGLDGSKIRSIISRALKKRDIQRIGRGVYAGA